MQYYFWNLILELIMKTKQTNKQSNLPCISLDCSFLTANLPCEKHYVNRVELPLPSTIYLDSNGYHEVWHFPPLTSPSSSTPPPATPGSWPTL